VNGPQTQRTRGDGLSQRVERFRCAKHPRRWCVYKWVWKTDEGDAEAWPECIRECGTCAEEEEGTEP